MSNRYARRHQPTARPRSAVPGGDDYSADPRSRTERDAARILYSPYYQRLADVTQIISPQSTDYVVHSRQAHAEKTAQIAESITAQLLHGPDGTELSIAVGGLDPAAALAGGRAHDLGHPPFGHVGEEELDHLGAVWKTDGFHGNAQSLRVVTKLAAQPGVELGLNLTRAALNATMKYPWPRPEKEEEAEKDEKYTQRRKYYSVYRSEVDDFEFAREAAMGEQEGATAEAQIVDYADDISYALHDVEDFWKVGLLSLRRLADDISNAVTPETVDRIEEKYPKLFDRREWYAALTRIATYMQEDGMRPLREPWTEERTQEVAIREFTSHFLTEWLNDISLQPDSDPQVALAPSSWHQINVLKQVTWDRVIARPALGAVQTGQRRVLNETGTILYDGLRTRPTSSPTRLRELHRLATDEEIERRDPPSDEREHRAASRAVLDYLASLTERQVVMIHGAVSGRDPLSMLPGWIQ